MIVQTRTESTMESTLQGRRIEMTVDQGAMAHIMGLLTNQYSEPELAIIREYSTNAADSHVEAGITRPIEVTLPTALSLYLKIRDYGTGMDIGDIERIYSQYGASTKRETNEQNGCLGIGCKAALAYADQFSLVTRKDGKCYTVSVSRDDQGRGSMTIGQTLDTDEENGVEVIIPCKRENKIAAKAEQFFKAWKPGTVLVNGVEPKPYDGLPVSDNMLVIAVDQGHFATDYVVMGNVSYPVERGKIDHGLARGFALVAHVGLGEVDFPPSREALNYNPHTVRTLQRIGAEFKANVQGSIQRQMDAASTPGEAVATMVRWHKMIPQQRTQMQASGLTYTYKGADVPTHFAADRIVYSSRISRHLSAASELSKLDASYWPTTLIVHGWDLAKLTPDQKKKLNKYVDDNGLNVDGYALVKDKPKLRWLDQVVDYEETIKPIKLNRANHLAGGTGRIPGSYDLYDAGTRLRGVPANDIDQSRPVFYTEGTKYGGDRYVELLTAQYPDAYVVVMPSTRIAKFKRGFPNAREAMEGVREKWAEFEKTTTPAQLKALACQRAGDTAGLRKLDPSRVDDPQVREAINIANVSLDGLQEGLRQFHRFSLDLKLPMWLNPLDKYPLYQNGYRTNMDHVIIYCNAVYAASTKEV